VASDRLVERRRVFQQYKEDVKERGKPFHPYAMLHDTIMSLVVVVVIIGLAIVWKVTAGDTPEEPGWLGKVLDEEADPGTISFTPRPDWYFFFLFYLLRIFKWPESVILGTVGIPTILLVLLLAIPFIDLRAERRLLRRPVVIVTTILVVLAMGVLTYKGATAKEALGSELKAEVPTWAKEQGFTGNRAATAGARLFAEAGCANCHIYLGDGGQNLGAPELTEEGLKNKGIDFQVEHLKCPSCVNKGSPMPSFAALGDERLRQLAVFLEASKGQQRDVEKPGDADE
jgi:ubiquinol-cytochrome c reductase cytochrome b subunit/menaquinol-cytochrome c reductase cytochrome b/c subunit